MTSHDHPLRAHLLRARLLRLLVAAAVLCAAPMISGRALAQSIERNLPPPPTALAPRIAGPAAAPMDQDATPIGPALRAIVVLGPKDPLLTGAPDGIDLSRTRLVGEQGAFTPFLGQTLSRRLITQIRAKVVRLYRDKGYPFVSLSTPEQEITTGVLQVRVLEFRLGAKTAPGASAKDAPYIESRVRVQPGEAIDTDSLSEDLDWLNRFPFRHTEAQFSPGAELGLTDLRLQTAELKPWAVDVGYADSGTPKTGWDRYFAGAQIVLPGLHDAYAAYQITGSGDALFDKDRPFNAASDPQYLSQAGRLVIPTLPRQDIEAVVSYVQSNSTVQDFLVRNKTLEATLAYRSALSNVWAPLPGEAALGVEAKRETSRTVFGGADVAGSSFDVFQITLAYAQQESDAFGRTSGDLTLHLSPGGVDSRNTDAVFAAFSKGRSDKADYLYIAGDLSRSTRLPPLFGVSGVSLSNSLIGQYATAPLPLTEQIGLGGDSLVRGYTLDDGAFDTGLVSRNELRAPVFSPMGRSGALADQISPYVFVDAGYGDDRRTHKTASPVSTGLGFDYQLGPHLTATVNAAWALNTTGFTKSGDAHIGSKITITF